MIEFELAIASRRRTKFWHEESAKKWCEDSVRRRAVTMKFQLTFISSHSISSMRLYTYGIIATLHLKK